MNVPVELKTESLMLREFAPADWRSVHAYASDPEVVKFEPWGPNTEEQTRTYVELAIRSAGESPRRTFELAVTLRDTGGLIGSTALRLGGPQGQVGEIGFTLNRQFWRRGYATEVARRLVAFGLDELGLHRIWATCDPENIGSAMALRRAGLRMEGRQRQARFLRGEWRDALLFALLATDERA